MAMAAYWPGNPVKPLPRAALKLWRVFYCVQRRYFSVPGRPCGVRDC